MFESTLHRTAADGIDLTDVSLFSDGPPVDAFRTLRELDPVHWSPAPPQWSSCAADGDGFWSLTRAAEIAEVAPDIETFSSDRGWYLNYETDAPVPLEALQGMLTAMQPPGHTRYRALLARAFTPNTVNRLEGRVRGQMTRILDRIVEHGTADLVSDVSVPLPTQVIADMLGFPEESAAQVFDWSLRLAATQDDDARGGGVEESFRALEEIVAYSNEIASQRRAEPRDDLLTLLATAEVDGKRLDEAGLGSFILQLLVAGNETSRNTLSIGVKELMARPEQWQRLVDEPQRIPMAVEECLRWAAPVYYMRRTATRDVELSGKQIRRGDKVVQWLVASNRDPALNERPEEFDVLREQVHHQTFGGGGRRFCLGAGLARLELRVALEELTRRLPDLAPAGEAKWLRSNFFGGLLTLPVRFSPSTTVLS